MCYTKVRRNIMQETEIKKQYTNGSHIFRDLANRGCIRDLVQYVYYQENPYINVVPSKSRLARNALVFFIQNGHSQAIELFFDSPFIKDIAHNDFIDAMKSLIYKDDIKSWNLCHEKYSLSLSEAQKENFITLACEHNAHNIVLSLLPKNNEISQEQKMSYLLKCLTEQNKSPLTTLKMLESHFEDLLYHQQDDILIATALKNKHNAVVNYLIFEKRLRLTKHINALSYAYPEFAQLLTTRKMFDSLEQKSKNQLEKNNPESIHNAIQKATKRAKI